MTETFTDRRVEQVTITRVDGQSATMSTGWSIAIPEGVTLEVGRQYRYETYRFNHLGGIYDANDGWLFRRSDEYFEEQHRKFLEDTARCQREELDKNRDRWQAAQDALPDWLRARLERFHANGGESFALEGWGYELMICQLAAMYAETGVEEESDAIWGFACEHGTTGNQHSCAKALVRQHQAAASVDLVPAGITPLTGNPDYRQGNA